MAYPSSLNISLMIHLMNAVEMKQWSNVSATIQSPIWRYYWNRKGCAIFLSKGRRYELNSTHALLIAPNTPFQRHAESRMDHFFVHFSVGPPVTGLEDFLLSMPLQSWEIDRLDHIRNTVLSGKARSFQASARIHALLFHSLSRIEGAQEIPSIRSPLIRAALQLLESDVVQFGSVQFLSKALGVSKKTLYRHFKDELGKTPSACVIRCKTRKAAMALQFTDATIEEIAARFGFCDRYHFTRAFTREYGCPPARFRKLEQ